MKKWIIFSLAGGIIMFIWQFLSFAMPNFHKAASQYTPQQDTLLATIEALELKEGMYMLGMPDPSNKEQGMQMKGDTYTWASLNYQINDSTSMARPMLRSILIDILIAIILLALLMQIKNPTLLKRILTSVGIGLLGFFYIAYADFIWYKEPDILAFLLDAIIPWTIMGWIGHNLLKNEEA